MGKYISYQSYLLAAHDSFLLETSSGLSVPISHLAKTKSYTKKPGVPLDSLLESHLLWDLALITPG